MTPAQLHLLAREHNRVHGAAERGPRTGDAPAQRGTGADLLMLAGMPMTGGSG